METEIEGITFGMLQTLKMYFLYSLVYKKKNTLIFCTLFILLENGRDVKTLSNENIRRACI